MSKKLAMAIAAAERDFRQAAAEADYLRVRALEAKNDMAAIACLADSARVELNGARRTIGEGYLRLMNSGISHREFLAFVREVEHVRI
jgi:hypothetical protein